MMTANAGERFLNLATGVFALCAISVAGVQVRKTFFPPNRGIQVSDTTTVTNWRDYSLGGVRMGRAAAAVTILEFADFQCSFCESAARYLSNLRDRYPRSVAVVYQHFPFHEFAMSAAIASQCAAEAGSFEAFHDLIYAARDAIGEKPWAVFARDAGVSDSLRFEHCINDSATSAVVNRDTLDAARLGVHGTPTFLINDLMLVGFPGPKRMDDLVVFALEGARKGRARH